ncbi:hypothetical protein [Clostridium sp.]|uniref:hypothetical protein n=1 Tax=Clostridium sp. TaxID=1506 RepID=UPI003995D79A
MAINKLRLNELNLSDLIFVLNKYMSIFGGETLDIDTLKKFKVREIIEKLYGYNFEVTKQMQIGMERDLDGTSLFYIHKTIVYLINVISNKYRKFNNMVNIG